MGGRATTVVLETNGRGHRLMYVARLAERLGDQRWVWVTSRAAAEGAEATVHLGQAPPPLATVFVESDASPSSRLRSALRTARDTGAAQVLIPDGDRYVPALIATALLGGLRRLQVSLLLMRTLPEAGLRATAKRAGKLILANLLELIPKLHIGRLVGSDGVGPQAPWLRRIREVPDAVVPYPKEVWEDLEAIVPAEAFVVLVAGVVDRRKNVAAVYQGVHLFGRDAVLVVAGRMEEGVRAELEGIKSSFGRGAAPGLVIIPRTLEDGELFSLIRRADVLVLMYDNDGPSGLLAIAQRTGTRVLANDLPQLADAVARSGLGTTCRPVPSSIAEALADLCGFVPEVGVGQEDKFAEKLLGLCS